MDIAILPTSYFGNIYYYYILNNYKRIIIEIYENYPKQTYRNRTRILTSNGIMDLSVPVKKKKNNFCYTKDIEIDYSFKWYKIHLNAIKSAYGKSPYFEYVYPEIERILNFKHKYLLSLNDVIINWIIEFTDLKNNIEYSKTYNKEITGIEDFRNYFYPTYNINADIFKKYIQVFSDRFEFIENLSIIDLLMNEGNNSIDYL